MNALFHIPCSTCSVSLYEQQFRICVILADFLAVNEEKSAMNESNASMKNEEIQSLI